MKIFFKYIIRIFGSAFLIALSIQYFADCGLRNLRNTLCNDWNNILEGKINSEIIINGSSRGYVGYNPEIISSSLKKTCFNLSFNAGGYNLQEDKFDIYIKENKKPKLLIQNIDLAHFGENTQLPDEWQFYPFVYNKRIDSLTAKFDNKFNLFKFIPLLKYNQNFKLLEEGIMANFSTSVKKNSETIKGYCPQEREFKIDYHNLKKFDIINVKPDNRKEIKILYEMLNHYKSNLDTNAKIIFVWMPEYKLRLTKSFDLRRASIIDELNLIQKNNKNFLFIDMAYDEMSAESKYYYDTFHLNKEGANVFSKKVSVKINNFLN